MDYYDIPLQTIIDLTYVDSLLDFCFQEDNVGDRIVANYLWEVDQWLQEAIDEEGCSIVFTELKKQIIWDNPVCFFNPELVETQTQMSSLSEKPMAQTRPVEVNR